MANQRAKKKNRKMSPSGNKTLNTAKDGKRIRSKPTVDWTRKTNPDRKGIKNQLPHTGQPQSIVVHAKPEKRNVLSVKGK